MTPDDKEPRNESAHTESTSPGAQRRAYHPPMLRRLGSVRDLTLGTGTKKPDTNGAGVTGNRGTM